MNLSFLLLAIVTLAGAGAAMALRRLVHCALCLTVAFVGLAALYLHLDAEFIGFAQILVYVGAVAILVLFAILLTRGPTGAAADAGPVGAGWKWGVAVAGATFGSLAAAIRASRLLPSEAGALPDITVRALGEQLLHRPEGNPDHYLLPLLVTGVLLTVAMIGAAIIAMPERREK